MGLLSCGWRNSWVGRSCATEVGEPKRGNASEIVNWIGGVAAVRRPSPAPHCLADYKFRDCYWRLSKHQDYRQGSIWLECSVLQWAIETHDHTI